MSIKITPNYSSPLCIYETEIAIKLIKDHFEHTLAKNLDLTRVSAPLFVPPESGLNDNLNGIERPVSFDCRYQKGELQIVQSLAKWKRYALKRYGFEVGKGLYTDMNAIRRDEETDNLHSYYVDQWDWELCIAEQDRTLDFLKEIVRKIYAAIKDTEILINSHYPVFKEKLPEQPLFITSQELLDKYPDLTAKEREKVITEQHRAVFICQIGAPLSGGKSHDGRAPDSDDWQLNGDLLLYHAPLDTPLEITSMGIRVNPESLRAQLKAANSEERSAYPFHQSLLNGELPYTIGGGIGQSRLCMFFLEKLHIGEVQSSTWNDDDAAAAAAAGINIL